MLKVFNSASTLWAEVNMNKRFIQTTKHWGNEDHWEGGCPMRTDGPKSEAKSRKRGGLFGEARSNGITIRPSTPSIWGRAPDGGCGGALWAPQLGLGEIEPRPPRGFPLFSAPKMASPDTILLIVDQKNWRILIPFDLELIPYIRCEFADVVWCF